MKLTNKYVVTIEGADGLTYNLENDGGIGPMSTGSDEWSTGRSWGGIGRIMTVDKAYEVFNQPDRGYGKAPLGRIIVSQIGLIPEVERGLPAPGTSAYEGHMRERVKAQAMAKLSAEEKKVLGL